MQFTPTGNIRYLLDGELVKEMTTADYGSIKCWMSHDGRCRCSEVNLEKALEIASTKDEIIALEDGVMRVGKLRVSCTCPLYGPTGLLASGCRCGGV